MALFKKKATKKIGDILVEKEAKEAFIGPPKPEPVVATPPTVVVKTTARKPSARDRMAGRTYRT